MSSPLLSTPEGGPSLSLSFDGRDVSAAQGDTVCSALIAAGRLMTSRSPKYRRARGAFCLSGDCGTCLVRVDGQPNVRACMTKVRSGMRVESQNVFSPAALDPTQLFDAVFRSGFDHHTFMVKPRIINQSMQTFARTLTGYGTLPDDDSIPEARSEFHQPHVCIVGAGKAGIAAANALREAGIDPLVLDRNHVAGSTQAGVFAAYPGERIVAGCTLGSEDEGATHVLHAVRPRHLVFATGRRDVVLPLSNNDLPGVVSAYGLIAMLETTGRRLTGDVVVVGEAELQEPAAQRLRALAQDGCTITAVDHESVQRFRGNAQVESVVTKDGRIPCSLVAMASTRAAAYDLAAQAGCAVGFEGTGFVVRRDDAGRAHRWGDAVTLWAAGGVAGAENSAADGARVAAAILAERSDLRREGAA